MGLWERLLDLLYPPRCAGCWRRGCLFCAACLAACRPLGQQGWRPAARPLRGLCGLYPYQPPLRPVIHAFKYQGQTGLARPLAALMAAALDQIEGLPRPAAISWVPLHATRQRSRGFNQAELLARELALQLNWSLTPGLTRLRHTAPQVGTDAEQRRRNVRDAFGWLSGVPAPAQVLVVDDVLTTGATLAACAGALSAAGAQEIYGLALACA